MVRCRTCIYQSLGKTKLTKVFCLVATKFLCFPSNFNQMNNISNPKLCVSFKKCGWFLVLCVWSKNSV